MDAQFFLKTLIIQNFATFKNQTVHFGPGFNAITGETGSGKSLILDALQLITGGKSDKRFIRKDTDHFIIEATFHCSDTNITEFLKNVGHPLSENHELIIKRIVETNGSSKAYMNHLHCGVNVLSTFSKKYIDLVGQFENQKLLSENYQLHLLDSFSKNIHELNAYQRLLKDFKEVQKKINELEESKNNRIQRLDYLDYQLIEIEKLEPSLADEKDLHQKKETIKNMDKIKKIKSQVSHLLEGSDEQVGAISQLSALSSLFSKNSDIFEEEVTKILEIQETISNLHESIEQKLESDIDTEEQERVVNRLDSYQKLKNKLGGTVESVLSTQGLFQSEKKTLLEQTDDLAFLYEKLSQLKNDLIKRSDFLHCHRLKHAKILEKELSRKIQELNMTGATIHIKVEKTEDLKDHGMNKVYFMAETNLGEGFHRIKEIASGGELSRILLATRQMLSKSELSNIFLFDEIDTGIGGETATCIGKALASASKNGQVIAITHLPQIAQFADSLVIVKKEAEKSGRKTRTESTINKVSGKNILKEIQVMAQLHL